MGISLKSGMRSKYWDGGRYGRCRELSGEIARIVLLRRSSSLSSSKTDLPLVLNFSMLLVRNAFGNVLFSLLGRTSTTLGSPLSFTKMADDPSLPKTQVGG